MRPKAHVQNVINALPGCRMFTSSNGVPIAVKGSFSICWFGKGQHYRVFDQFGGLGPQNRYDCQRVEDVVHCIRSLADGKPTHSINKGFLANRYKSEEAIGIVYKGKPGEEISYLPDGEEFGRCTNSADYVVRDLEQGDVYGFLVEDNPVAHHDVDCAGGHDFAVIQGRFIVDLWISHYTGSEKQVVFDMKDDLDRVKIKEIYGDPAKWAFKLDGRFVKPGDARYPDNRRLDDVLKTRSGTREAYFELSGPM